MPNQENYSFNNFIENDCNSLAVNICKAIVQNPGGEYKSCLIYGGVGLGKTHLMKAIKNGIHNKYPEKKIVYNSAETFINEFSSSISTNTHCKFKNE